ncbi:MAG UNVERIFIED_CONTAM: response regulator transcription factor [Rickettsiaceae bacterium]
MERHWFSVTRADSIDAALHLFSGSIYNFVVLSSKLGSKKVLDMIEHVRSSPKNKELPILLILEESEEISLYNKAKDTALEIMKRPFAPAEFLSNVKSLLRKSNPVFQDKIIKYKDLTMDLATYKVQRAGKKIHLGPTEFKIMQMLIQSPKTILSREKIIEYVWGEAAQNIEPRTVDVHVNRLRSLVKINDTELPFIKTVRAAGYCLNLPGERD